MLRASTQKATALLAMQRVLGDQRHLFALLCLIPLLLSSITNADDTVRRTVCANELIIVAASSSRIANNPTLRPERHYSTDEALEIAPKYGKVIKVLHRGGEGLPVLIQKPDGKLYVLKFGTPERLRGEARVSTKLAALWKEEHSGLGRQAHCPFIQTTYHADDGILEMEYIPHQLGNTIEKYGAQHPEDLRRLVTQLIDTVDFLHRNKIVHRDIKSSNLLVDEKGNLHLIDFGFTAPVNEYGNVKEDAVVGTPTIMSENQWMSGPASFQDDLSGVRVTLLEAIIGKLYSTPSLETDGHVFDRNILGRPVPEFKHSPSLIDPEVFRSHSPLSIVLWHRSKSIGALKILTKRAFSAMDSGNVAGFYRWYGQTILAKMDAKEAAREIFSSECAALFRDGKLGLEEDKINQILDAAVELSRDPTPTKVMYFDPNPYLDTAIIKQMLETRNKTRP